MEDGGVSGPLGVRAYWNDGIHFDSPKNNLRFKINGQAAFDGGAIFADRVNLPAVYDGAEQTYAARFSYWF